MTNYLTVLWNPNSPICAVMKFFRQTKKLCARQILSPSGLNLAAAPGRVRVLRDRTSTRNEETRKGRKNDEGTHGMARISSSRGLESVDCWSGKRRNHTVL